jgi:endonuclease YncB( thermonuclease family)
MRSGFALTTRHRSRSRTRSTKVKGSATYDAIRNGKITVRLQGMDAPELHYRPVAAKKKADQTEKQHTLYLKWNLEFRQLLAESATIALTAFFQDIGSSPIPCIVRTAVDAPDEVFDTYGRFVGDIFVHRGGDHVDVNHWIVENGWAFPAFYSSMSEPEITTIVDLANQAFDGGLGVWPRLNDFARVSDFRHQSGFPREGEDDLRLVLKATCVRNGAATACVSRRSS